MAAGSFNIQKASGGVLNVQPADGVTNTNLVLPESGTVVATDVAVTDNAIARYDGTTGKVKNSAITIDNSGNIGSGTQSFNGFGGSGFKNYIINGGFDVWQRGENFTSEGYTADRWFTQFNGNCTVSREWVSYNNTAKLSWTSAGTYKNFLTSVEDGARKLQGKTLTLSFKAMAATPGMCTIYIGKGVTAGSSSEITRSDINLTTLWQTFTITFTMPIYDNSNMTLVLGLISMQLLGNSNTVNVKEFQLEEGSAATPFENRPYGMELSLCQRYYEVCSIFGSNYSNSASGTPMRTTQVQYKIRKRAVPTIVISNTTYFNSYGIGTESSIVDSIGINAYCSGVGTLWCSGTLTASAEL